MESLNLQESFEEFIASEAASYHVSTTELQRGDEVERSGKKLVIVSAKPAEVNGRRIYGFWTISMRDESGKITKKDYHVDTEWLLASKPVGKAAEMGYYRADSSDLKPGDTVMAARGEAEVISAEPASVDGKRIYGTTTVTIRYEDGKLSTWDYASSMSWKVVGRPGSLGTDKGAEG